ncbi:MAG: rhodanese-like domain-containing protein [Clostridia bacterium]|nr:rhodanese-like domain-containing protein [Clostridia bacterium]
MKKIISIGVVLILCFFSFVGCANEENNKENIVENSTESSMEHSMENTYTRITPQEAKNLMDTETDYVILDTRTTEEFAEGHIEGAIMIPEYEIADRAKKDLPNKDQLILVYCRSGRRSKIAADELVKLGYTNVKEFGGIIDWPYEVVK